MPLTLYHCEHARSLRPLWTLSEMGLAHELVTMPFPPRVHVESFLEINPLGTVPTLIDGDVHMTESVAICQYLVERYGPTPLAVAPDEADYPAYLNWLQRADSTFTFPLALVFRYGRLEPEERRLPQVVEDYTRWFFGRLRSLETGLEGRDYLCAGRFTIADISVGFALYFARRLGLEDRFRPNTKAYLERLMARPAIRRTLAKDG